MDYTSIKLLLNQVDVAFSKSRVNVYSDKKKETHYNELHKLYLAISKQKIENFNPNDVVINFDLLVFILNGLEYLDNSTLNVIPYELVSCLELVLKEWLDIKNIIIVTSLSNKHLEYLFNTSLNAEAFEQYNQAINTRYGFKITNRLIRITLPKSLSRDYLSSVALYHELGHFIDFEFSISQKIAHQRYIGIPQDQVNQNEANIFFNHTLEYFADIFASQYVNTASNCFLQRITMPINFNKDSHSHPSTQKRIKTVNAFLAGNQFKEIKEFNNVLSACGKPILKIRHDYIEPSISNFNDLIPQKINNELELHSIFNLAWELWLNSENNFLKHFDSKEQYKIINNLVEKSISNYTILQQWQNGGN